MFYNLSLELFGSVLHFSRAGLGATNPYMYRLCLSSAVVQGYPPSLQNSLHSTWQISLGLQPKQQHMTKHHNCCQHVLLLTSCTSDCAPMYRTIRKGLCLYKWRDQDNHCMMKAFQHDFQFFPLPCRARGLATRLAFDGQSANASDSPGMATPSVRLKRPIRYARSVVKRVSDVLKQVWFMASCCSEENVCKLTCWTYYDYQVFASRTKVQCITLTFT